MAICCHFILLFFFKIGFKGLWLRKRNPCIRMKRTKMFFVAGQHPSSAKDALWYLLETGCLIISNGRTGPEYYDLLCWTLDSSHLLALYERYLAAVPRQWSSFCTSAGEKPVHYSGIILFCRVELRVEVVVKKHWCGRIVFPFRADEILHCLVVFFLLCTLLDWGVIGSKWDIDGNSSSLARCHLIYCSQNIGLHYNRVSLHRFWLD